MPNGSKNFSVEARPVSHLDVYGRAQSGRNPDERPHVLCDFRDRPLRSRAVVHLARLPVREHCRQRSCTNGDKCGWVQSEKRIPILDFVPSESAQSTGEWPWVFHVKSYVGDISDNTSFLLAKKKVPSFLCMSRKHPIRRMTRRLIQPGD